MIRILLLLALVLPVWAQTVPTFSMTDAPGQAVQRVFLYTGTDVTAICFAPSAVGSRNSRLVAISAVSKASAAVVTSTGHGFSLSSRPSVTISGATGTGWTAINGTFVATIIDADTFSIAVNSTGFGTLAGTVVFGTSAPRTTIAEWAVQRFVWDGSHYVIWSGWIGGTVAFNQRCTDATVTTVTQQ